MKFLAGTYPKTEICPKPNTLPLQSLSASTHTRRSKSMILQIWVLSHCFPHQNPLHEHTKATVFPHFPIRNLSKLPFLCLVPPQLRQGGSLSRCRSLPAAMAKELWRALAGFRLFSQRSPGVFFPPPNWLAKNDCPTNSSMLND